jgi:hypothetical protein
MATMAIYTCTLGAHVLYLMGVLCLWQLDDNVAARDHRAPWQLIRSLYACMQTVVITH